ncbi:DUF5839 family protein [Secundilactobacillus collinoides]|uniref:Uncharacterized protein n=2 Tax=Secundilactobacillus collinoides TaxID=33960 RepID=A0A0R2BD66_SECCO|nr:DUF5839 family protein [Secundilactobacillus collinoides]KRM74409.1 hypothetical protein FC82_GL000167 [Secundilactobacillus collinoides DSM 20515 = JCM 1123]KZL39753.1 hypothetical protein TY91_09755 [Secundilactobacillus collinoides]
MREKKQAKQTQVKPTNIIGALHINVDDNGQQHLNTEKIFYWRLGMYTKNATSGKKTTVLPALGTIASVFTQFGRQDVMVVQTFQSGIDQASQTQVSHLRRVFTTSDAGSPDKIVSKEYEAYMTKNHLK